MKVLNFILAGMFFLFALVQYNDPDPFIWILIYSYAAILCFLAGINKYYKKLLLSGIIISIIWSLTLAASILIAFKNHGINSLYSFGMIKGNEVEEARESLGLLIVAAVLFWKFLEGKKKNLLT
ncbi:MAG: transmembrane 220 family protein [Leptospiraceae bacterium]|nr:transmembrane 220 family protein [Leptospiraceae bacterium]